MPIVYNNEGLPEVPECRFGAYCHIWQNVRFCPWWPFSVKGVLVWVRLQALILLPNHLLQMVAKAGSRSFSGGCQVVKRGRFPPTTGGVGEPMRRRKPLSANDEG